MENEHYEAMGRTDFSNYDEEPGWFGGKDSYNPMNTPTSPMPEDSQLVEILAIANN